MAFDYAIALTGSIATGKSSVAKWFVKQGFRVIDADSIAHDILDAECKKIEIMFGKDLVSAQKVDRQKLGALVFSDKKKRARLESFLHPLIFTKIETESYKEDVLKKPYLIDIPLFFESNRYLIERSLVVYTPKETQLKRLMQRNGYNEEEARLRISLQEDIEEKRKKATYLIDNSGDLTTLWLECERVKEEIAGDFK